MVEVLYTTETPGASTTIPNADGALTTGNIKPNMYKYTKISTIIQVTVAVGSTVQQISFKIKLGTTVLKTIKYTVVAEARVFPLALEYIGDVSLGGAVNITASAAAADANTSCITQHLYVLGLQ